MFIGDFMYRKTYAKINLENIKYNVSTLVNKLNNYKYHFGVCKADSYGHIGNEVVDKIIEGGCNYLAVATLEEALDIRKDFKDIPILILGIIDKEYLNLVKENNLTITISNMEYAKELDNNNLKVHIKINTGMNRLGISIRKDFIDTYNLLKDKGYIIEGVYTHIYNDAVKEDTLNQVNCFKEITDGYNIPIVHIGASGYALNYSKVDFVNGIRFGIAMYGLIENNLNLKSTFSLYSTIIQINEVDNKSVGYNGAYKVNGNEKIAVVPIGYADGIIRKNTGRYVYINDKKYPIVGNICMDMLFVKVDDTINVGDTVILLKDNQHIMETAKYLDTICYEVICNIGKRIPRIYE